MSNVCTEGTDKGYIFSGPHIEDRTKKVKQDFTLVAYHHSGVIISENPKSPWHHATFLGHGTIVRDSEGKVVQKVALCETTDADGDSTWSILWQPAERPGTFQFVVGTGKWEGITGEGKTLGMLRSRADDYFMPKWEICWKADKGNSADTDALDKERTYTDHDTGLSFHGPHVTVSTKELANGITLVFSHQSGVLISDNPEAVSPRNYATVFDRGTTIKEDDKTLGDVMLLEDTDPDGDVAWLCHVWWYGKGPGTYQFIGGTGKWKGITGEGKTLGMLRSRTDDHYMLKSEMHWRIDRVFEE